MEKNVLQSISGVAVYPLISLIIFLSFFLGLGVYVFLTRRQHLAAMSRLPLDEASLQTHLQHDILC